MVPMVAERRSLAGCLTEIFRVPLNYPVAIEDMASAWTRSQAVSCTSYRSTMWQLWLEFGA